MAFSWLLFFAPLLVAAQTTTFVSSVAASSAVANSTTSPPITHTVSVAYGGFTFSPDVTLAEVGDIIEYEFFPPNHSVARSEFGYPCIPYEDTGVDKIGFFSGFKPVDAILPDPPTFSIRVNDTEPIFFYCTAPNSCIGHQMVGVINPNASTPLGVQKQLAANSSFMLQPGEPWPSESEDPFTTGSAGAGTTTTAPIRSVTSAAPAATSTTAVPAPASSSSGLTSGAIAGIAIGATAVAIIAAALLYMCGRQSRRYEYPQHGPPQTFGGVSHMSYTHPKHMSTLTTASGVYAAPTPPGYVPQHDPALSPPLLAAYPVNDGLHSARTGGSDGGAVPVSPSSPAASQVGLPPAAPAYVQVHPQHIQQYPTPDGVHEMEGSEQSGIMNFIRKASTRKTGVERYG